MLAEPATPPSALGLLLRGLGALALVAFIALLVYGVLTQAPDTTIDDSLSRSDAVPAPGFELAALQRGRPGRLGAGWDRAAADGRVNLRELRGTPVVVNFWASWCDPCRKEAPVLERGWIRARERGVLFLGLDMQDVSQDARGFLSEFSLSFPNVRDPTNDTAREWGATGIPETFFINARGEVVGHVIGTVTKRQLGAGVAAALSGRPRGADQGGEQRPTR